MDELGIETAILLQEKMQQGEWVIVAADRVPVQSDRVQNVEFLGETATLPQGAWILANLLKVPVLAVFCYRVQQNFQVHIHHISDQVDLPRKNRLSGMQQVTQLYIACLEQHCLRAPYQWFNFYQFWTK
ncbi:putative acyltransferase [Acinetobacter sp. NBRC 100985]|nr:putative acyltransferase [Acinetobacter sp. NBRC 100985]